MKNKKILFIIISIILVILLIVGIVYYNETRETSGMNLAENDIPKENDVMQINQKNLYNKDFGSYELLDGWTESKEHSTNNKFFYVLEGEEQAARPNNISVNEGKNKYTKEEHSNFKNAILNQLSMQIGNRDGITINANGSNTDNNYILYTFIIHEEEENITTTQYYIVGDYKYVLVHETIYGDSEQTTNVAKHIVNTFKWK